MMTTYFKLLVFRKYCEL